MAEPATDRVSPARRVAFEVIRRTFEHGAWTDRALPATADRHGLAARERAHAQRLAYGTVQRRGTAHHLLARLAERDPGRLDAGVRAALELGLYELLFASATPDHAAVDQAVELAKGALAGKGARRAAASAGFVNAVLRRVAAERKELLAALDDATPQSAAIAHSLPEWLAEMWFRELGPDIARSLMRAANEPAETALRVNTLRTDPAVVLGELQAAGQEVEAARGPGPLAQPETLVVSGPMSPPVREGIAAGMLIPQSRASQAVVGLLDPAPGDRILDLCAGPGVKTTAIAARARGEARIEAVEIHAARAREIESLAERLGVAGCVHVTVADASEVDAPDGYDRVLVDAPCSDLGTLAARPDVRWRKSPEAVDRLSRLQAAILARGALAVRPGGALVYSTCTISRREGDDPVSALLADTPELAADDLGAAYPDLASPHDSRFLQIRPDRDGTDGFFIARLRKEGG